MQNVIAPLEELGGEMVMRNTGIGVRAETTLPLDDTETSYTNEREHSSVSSSSGERS